MFDILDVNLTVPMCVATSFYLERLGVTLGEGFEMEVLQPTGQKMLHVRIICIGAEYQSVVAMEEAIRQIVDVNHFPWQRFGGVRVGETTTVQF